MKVNYADIVLRGLCNNCPNCGKKTLFERAFRMNKKCPECDLSFDRGEGFYLGSMSINYGFTLACCLTPIAVFWYLEWISGTVAGILAVFGAVFCPILTYRSSRSWWLMAYYLVLLHELPANRTEDIPVDDD